MLLFNYWQGWVVPMVIGVIVFYYIVIRMCYKVEMRRLSKVLSIIRHISDTDLEEEIDANFQFLKGWEDVVYERRNAVKTMIRDRVLEELPFPWEDREKGEPVVKEATVVKEGASAESVAAGKEEDHGRKEEHGRDDDFGKEEPGISEERLQKVAAKGMIMEQLKKEVKLFLGTAAENQLEREVVVGGVQTILGKEGYWLPEEDPYRKAVSDIIRNDLKSSCAIELDDEEIKGLWARQSSDHESKAG